MMAAKRTPKPRDLNQRAAAIVAQATGDDDCDDDTQVDPVAVEHGRQGGHARARRLTPEQRSQAASKAARARWENAG